MEAWPYAPHLMKLLEDQVLVATHAQETRDLIRILADLFKRNEDKAVITAADFRLDDEKSGIAALLDSVANQHHSNLLEKAQRNLEAVQDAVTDVGTMAPHLRELIGALWLRSLCEGNIQGASAAELQVDITRDKAIDEAVRGNLFIPEDFTALVLAAAKGSESVGKLMKELQEPRPNGEDCIPWLGETLMKERLLRICARGDIALNLRSMEYLQVQAGEDENTAWLRMKSKLGFSGKHLDETYILLPQNVPATGGTSGEDGGLFGGETGGTSSGEGGTGGSHEETGGQGSGGGGGPSGIFGGGGEFKAFQTDSPTSALNLAGRLETWGVNPGTQVHDASITVSKMTGAQLAKLVKNLPDGLTYNLSIKREDTK